MSAAIPEDAGLSGQRQGIQCPGLGGGAALQRQSHCTHCVALTKMSSWRRGKASGHHLPSGKLALSGWRVTTPESSCERVTYDHTASQETTHLRRRPWRPKRQLQFGPQGDLQEPLTFSELEGGARAARPRPTPPTWSSIARDPVLNSVAPESCRPEIEDLQGPGTQV